MSNYYLSPERAPWRLHDAGRLAGLRYFRDPAISLKAAVSRKLAVNVSHQALFPAGSIDCRTAITDRSRLYHF
jgi:hypothetical protein